MKIYSLAGISVGEESYFFSCSNANKRFSFLALMGQFFLGLQLLSPLYFPYFPKPRNVMRTMRGFVRGPVGPVVPWLSSPLSRVSVVFDSASAYLACAVRYAKDWVGKLICVED